MNQKMMLAELWAMAALHSALMSPCLLVSATMQHWNEQQKYMQQMQVFLNKLQSDREFALCLIMEQDNWKQLTFLLPDDLAQISDGLSKGHAIAYKKLCQSAGND